MGVEIIGKQIASMRKEKGIKQEEIANYVGVSAQAVSKWENGGIPDTELLPKIADFFGVSIDSLFGRNITDYSDLRSALIKKICDTPHDERFKLVFNYCWDMERALMPHGDGIEKCSIEDYEKGIGTDEQHYSSVMQNDGFTRMGIANRSQYFLIVPDPQSTDDAYFHGIDYPAFFKDISDVDFWNACVYLNKRDYQKAFTTALFINKLGIDAEKTGEILSKLKKYKMVYSAQIEMDDEIQTVYHFIPTPSFIALLIFSREIIEKPEIFSYYNGDRDTPYIK
ncbi:MAG: helix-turn-helix transcriptional regulator [Oscillospiraceae bacterium]|nr:helix-turn-helix transcriptional regulator [Oscillospiraceae bacterium]